MRHTLRLDPTPELASDPLLHALVERHREFHGESPRIDDERCASHTLEIDFPHAKALRLSGIFPTSTANEESSDIVSSDKQLVVVSLAIAPRFSDALTPIPIWAFGIHALISSPQVAHIGLAPTSRSIPHHGSTIAVDLLPDGQIRFPRHDAAELSGRSSPLASPFAIRAVNPNRTHLSATLVVDALEIQSGYAQQKRGLAFWQFYRPRRALNKVAAMILTCHVPKSAESVDLLVHTFARAPRSGGDGQHHWAGPTSEVTLPLEDFDPLALKP